MSGHTKGPWVVKKHGSKRRILAADGTLTVAHVPIGCMTNDLPNARAISALPDLLEALKSARPAVAHVAKTDPGAAVALDMLDAAIAKAEGQQ